MGVIGYFVLLPFRRLVGPAAMQMLGGGGARNRIEITLPQSYATCVIYVLASFLLSFPFANTPKMQRS